jgi:integrase
MTANGDLTVLKAVLNFAFREGKVSSDGAWRVVQAFRGVHRSKAPYLTLEQCQKLIPLCTPDFRLLVCAALLTGARLMELTRLTAEDYNPRAGTVHFAPAKTRWARHVFLTDEGREFFDERVKNLLPGDLLFRRQDGERWRQADPCHRLRIPAREAGLGHISFHIFRHTYASLLAEQGTNMAVIAKNMGHRQTEVCERYYAHLSEGYVATEIRARLPVLGVK